MYPNCSFRNRCNRTLGLAPGLKWRSFGHKVIRGGKKTFSVDLASRIAEGSGLLPSVLIPTCEKRKLLLSRNPMSNKYFFFHNYRVFLNKCSRSKLPGITGIFPFVAFSVKLTPKEIKKPVTDPLQTCGIIVGIQCHG